MNLQNSPSCHFITALFAISNWHSAEIMQYSLLGTVRFEYFVYWHFSSNDNFGTFLCTKLSNKRNLPAQNKSFLESLWKPKGPLPIYCGLLTIYLPFLNTVVKNAQKVAPGVYLHLSYQSKYPRFPIWVIKCITPKVLFGRKLFGRLKIKLSGFFWFSSLVLITNYLDKILTLWYDFMQHTTALPS